MDEDMDAFMGRNVAEIKKVKTQGQLDAEMDAYMAVRKAAEVDPDL